MKAKVHAALAGDAGVAAIAGDRIYPVILPQRAAFPAVSYLFVSGGPVNTLGGSSGSSRARVQADCWATSYKVVMALAKAVRAAMEGATGFTALTVNQYDGFEPDGGGPYRAVLDFSIFGKGD